MPPLMMRQGRGGGGGGGGREAEGRYAWRCGGACEQAAQLNGFSVGFKVFEGGGSAFRGRFLLYIVASKLLTSAF